MLTIIIRHGIRKTVYFSNCLRLYFYILLYTGIAGILITVNIFHSVGEITMNLQTKM